MSLNKIILILLLLGGGYFWWYKYDHKKRYETQVGALSSLLSREWFSEETPEKEVTTKFMKVILTIDGYRDLFNAGKIKIPVDEFVKDAVRRSLSPAPSSDETDLITRACLDTFNLCERTRVLDDATQVRGMNEGKPPVIQAGNYKGERLVLARRLPMQFSRDAMNHPANLTLLPESVYAQIWPYTASDPILKAADDFNRARLIDSAHFTEVKKSNDKFRSFTFR